MEARDDGRAAFVILDDGELPQRVAGVERARRQLRENLCTGSDCEGLDQRIRDWVITEQDDKACATVVIEESELKAWQNEFTAARVDDQFRAGRYRAQVAGSINDAKVGKGIPTTQLMRVPLLLCGGGSRMQFYGNIGESINGTRGWDVSVETMRLPVPQDLVDTGWHADDFDRQVKVTGHPPDDRQLLPILFAK